MRKYIAELIGTFALVFCGTGAIIINQESGGMVTHVGVAITFGLVVAAMIYAFGDISGAHLNPAVTISFSIAKLFPVKEVVPYIISQILGGFAASLLLRFLFPSNFLLGATVPAGPELQSFILEIILSFILMTVIMSVAKGSKEQGMMAGIAIGSVVLFEALFAGPICGASMNPVRSLCPAIISGYTTGLWIYMLAPPLGMILSVFVWNFLKPSANKIGFKD